MTEDNAVDELLSLRKMQFASWIYLVVLSAVSWIFGSWPFAYSVFAGGVISILSFFVSHKDVIGYFGSLSATQEKEEIKKSKSGFLIRFWFRLGCIGIVLLLLIKSGKVNIFGLILGLSTVVFTVTLTALSVAGRYLFRRRR